MHRTTRRSTAIPAMVPPPTRFLSLVDAAEILGMSAYTLRDWGLSGKITTHKFGSVTRISTREMDRIIAEAERPRVA